MPDALSTLPPPAIDIDAADPLAESLPSRVQLLLEWLAGHPLVPPATGLAAGIALDAARAVPLWVASALFIVSGGMILFFRRSDGWRHFAIAIAALAVGAPLHDAAFRRWPANHVVRYTNSGSTPCRLTGTLMSAPAIRPVSTGRITWYPQLPHTRLFVAAEKLEGITGDIPVTGTMLVNIDEPVLHAAAGDRVELFGRMYRPSPPNNPGEADWALKNRRNDILVEMSCDHAANVVVRSIGAGRSRWMATLRNRARLAMLDETFPGEVPGSRLLEALVLGQRSAVDPELNAAFVATGTVHYLSVSGAHVGMLASLVWLIGALLGLSHRVCAVLAMILLTGYACLAEPNAPIIRSAVMADLFCIAILLRRPARVANWLALSAIVLLICGPTQLFDPGFQMSFLTIAALIYLAPSLQAILQGAFVRWYWRYDKLLSSEVQLLLTPPAAHDAPLGIRLKTAIHRRKLMFWRAVPELLVLPISAWLVSVVLGTYHFHQAALWGWLNTLLVLPLIWLALVLGLTKTVVSSVFPAGGWLLGGPLTLVTNVLIAAVRGLAHLPAAWANAPLVSPWLAVVGLLLLGLIALWPALRLNARHTSFVLPLAFCFVIMSAWTLAPRAAGDQLRVHILSVGSGTTSVIELPNGKTLIYDIGSRPPYDVQRWTLSPLLAREHVYRIDAVVLSHPDLDHFGGLPDLIERRSVAAVITAPHFDKLASLLSPAQRLITEMKTQGVRRMYVQRGDRLTGTGETSIEVLWPPPPAAFQISETNESSVVLRVTYAGKRILLCGDIQDAAQRRLIRTGDLKADVLVLPHHGGLTTSTRSFIRAVAPKYCIRSSGQRDAASPRELFSAVSGSRYFNTADDGAVEICASPGRLAVQAFRPRQEPAPQ